MRAIAEECFAMVREYKGSHSGEHGDGLVRSEFHEDMFGPALVRGLRGGQGRLRPRGLLQPRQDRPPAAMDDRPIRFPPGYRADAPSGPALDWSAWGGFAGAAEMCNNNGACRKADPA